MRVDGGQQQVARRRRAGAGCRPECLQYAQDTGLLGREPERTGQAEVTGSRGKRDWGGTVLDQGGDLVGRAEISLVDNAGFTLDARAFDDVVVELVTFFLGDEGGHI